MVNPRLTHVFSEGDVFFCDFRLFSMNFLLEIRCRRNWKKDQKVQKMDEKIKPEPPIGASAPRDGSILILSTCSVIGTNGPWDG
jgi:hypothetical protein